MPDDWNEGKTAADSTMSLILDNDDDNDGISDLEDVFPMDPNESADSDSDGYGNNIDAFPFDPEVWFDQDSDGVETEKIIARFRMQIKLTLMVMLWETPAMRMMTTMAFLITKMTFHSIQPSTQTLMEMA